MIPHTYPNNLNPFSDMSQCVITYLSSVSGMTAWTDYIPVRTVSATGNIEGRTEATGYQAVYVLTVLTNKTAWIDYIPVYEDGTKTVAWSTDANGYIPIGISEAGAEQILSEAEFQADLTHSLVLDAGTGSPTFTRATTGTIQDNEGVLRTAIAGEARFTGARRVENLIRLGAAQSSTLAIGASVTMTLPAGTYIFSQGVSVGTATFSGTGGATGTLAASASVRTSVVKTITAGTLIVTGSVAILTDIQVENITGRTDQTTPSEYVSVGVLSAPYHGAGVDGVKFFDTDLDGNALPTTQAYDYVQLNGTAGTYLSTPDSVANSITGDIDIRWYGSLPDWTPTAANYALVAKNNGAGNRTFIFWVQPTGELSFQVSSDGTAVSTATSSASTGIADGATKWVRVTRASASGNVNFYTSDDGSIWSLVGLADRTTTAGSLFDSAAALEVGAYGAGSTYPASGKFYQAKIYNGINSTLAVDFDASRYAGGTTLTGSTGETWTLNGSAWGHPSNSPMKGYLSEPAATNLCLQSADLGTTWTNNNTTESTNATTAPDGTTTADKLIEAATNTSHTIYNTVAGTSGVYTISVYLKAAERTWAYITEGNSVTATAYFDLANGVVGTVSGTGSPSSKIVDVGGGWYRCSMTFTAGANANIQIGTSTGDAISTFLGDITKGIYVWGAQLELGSAATSYIATTTTAVTRNVDVLTYTGGDIANLKTLAATFRREVGVSNVGVVCGVSDTTLNNFSVVDLQSATAVKFEGTKAGAAEWATTASNAYTPATFSKAAWSAAANDIKMDFNGTAQTQDTTAAIPGTTVLDVGHVAGSFQLNGHVGHIYGWTTNKSQSELGAIDR